MLINSLFESQKHYSYERTYKHSVNVCKLLLLPMFHHFSPQSCWKFENPVVGLIDCSFWQYKAILLIDFPQPSRQRRSFIAKATRIV